MSTELYVSRRGRQTWAALREDGKTTELRVETPGDCPSVGRIVRARVTRVVPGIQSAFVDLGSERDGFLHVTDLWLPGEEQPPEFPDGSGPELEDSVSGGVVPTGRSTSSAPIEDRLKAGRELIVQVARGALGNKGARVTCYLTLPGRLLVLFPQLSLRRVSRRIVDSEERQRLQALVAGLPGGDIGFVARTAAAGAEEAELWRDAESLLEAYRDLQRGVATGGPPGELHGDRELALRLLRDAPPEGFGRIVFDDPEMRDRALAYAAEFAPDLEAAIELHQGPRLLFESVGLDHDIARALRSRVWLKSGGYLVIEPTEALVSIDVNTGKFLGRSDPEETALKTNSEAAAEIARQLRLRDLGGIIVVDFIDMGQAESRERVVAVLAAALKRDRARTQIHEWSALGLLQLTRKRTRPATDDLLTKRCDACVGNGRIKRPETVAALADGELRRLAAATPRATFVLSAGRPVLDSLGPLPEHIEVRLQEDVGMAPDDFRIRLIPAPLDGGGPCCDPQTRPV